MKYVTVILMFAVIILSLVCYYDSNKPSDIDTITVRTVDTVFVEDVRTVTLPGKLTYLTRTSVDTVRIADSLMFIAQTDTIIKGDSYVDSIMVTYAYPQNIFTITNKLNVEHLIVKETTYIPIPKKMRYGALFGVYTGKNEYAVSLGAFADFKGKFNVGLVGNTNKQIGIQVGVPLGKE